MCADDAIGFVATEWNAHDALALVSPCFTALRGSVTNVPRTVLGVFACEPFRHRVAGIRHAHDATSLIRMASMMSLATAPKMTFAARSAPSDPRNCA